MKLRTLLFSCLLFLGIIFISQQALAACDGWIFAGNCETTIPVCQGANCTLDGGVAATGEVVGDLTKKPISQYIQDIVAYLLTFVSIIAVIYIIYAGFQIMIGAGDEEKNKKAKQIIISVTTGIILMWLAYAIVGWVMRVINVGGTGNPTTPVAQFFSIPRADAAFSESDLNTFSTYKEKIKSKAQDIESELRINGKVGISSLQSLKNLVNEAYDRLPDTPDLADQNQSLWKGTILLIDLAIRSPGTTKYVGDAIGGAVKFTTSAKIQEITGTISATPSSGNAPLTVSFLANNVKDPSGVTPVDNNYIWWMRDQGGIRRELGRGKSLVRIFDREGTYQVFLDVVSGSRNSKGRVDVLPLTISQSIEVLPRLGEIVLLVNGVNVSNLNSIKVNPTIGKLGILIDATASRAIGNGVIKKTSWDFGNGNTSQYDGGPVIEKQVYANQGKYKLNLEIETNIGTKIQKSIQIVVVDPAAVISTEKETGYIDEDFKMSAYTYFGASPNVEYSWSILPEGGQNTPIYQQTGKSFSYKFKKVGKYIITLSSRSPNGSEDRDSRWFTIESRDPIVNLDEPKPISSERPNTIRFDASRSYDPDTNSTKDLTYEWMIDGELVELENIEKNGAIGTYTFSEKGPHTVSLTVTNIYGKVKQVEKKFTVTSTLSAILNISPRVAPINTTVTMFMKSPKASFFEWNTGDNTPSLNGEENAIQHVYKKTGIYTTTVTVRDRENTESNTITKRIYITDTNSPFALIDLNNASKTIIDDPVACGEGGAFLINRSEGTVIDGGNSINVDGSTAGLTYTWKYLDRVKTGPSFTEKFTELGCFPIELTVKSIKNGASHTSRRYVQIKNIPPKLTNLTHTIDTTKKDSQKILVSVTANGARDEDGVITSYTWYYFTESDREPQSVTITQSPKKTFVLPNVSEKYYFGVIIEDNDGARVNSADAFRDQNPLMITNDDGNINMPLITLKTSKSIVKAGESTDFTVQAKTIIGTDITSKSEYAWDFDGDGKIDRKTQEPRVSYTYKNSGNYTLKVKVIYNGVSNSKFQTITVRNELKAKYQAYKKGDTYFLLNTSDGIFQNTTWQVGNIQSNSLYSVGLNVSDLTNTGVNMLTVSSNDDESSTIPLNFSEAEDIGSMTGVLYQSSPRANNDTIDIKGRSEKVILSFFGNTNATRYILDTDTKIDNDLNGTPDDDEDNADTPSFENGAAFVIQDFENARNKERIMKLRIYQGETLIGEKEIRLRFGFISDTPVVTTDISTSTGGVAFSDREKSLLESLQAKIRNLTTDDRLILTQSYNELVENWDDTFARTKKLIDIQELVNASTHLSEGGKKELSDLIDTILIGDAQASDEITIATKVLESLIPDTNSNKAVILEKIQEIRSHPSDLAKNKEIGTSILEIIANDKTIEDKYKLIIKAQLIVIVNGGQESVPAEENTAIANETAAESSGFFGGVSAFVNVFFIILAVFVGIAVLGFIYFLLTKKKGDSDYGDFLIDSVKGGPSPEPKAPLTKDPPAPTKPVVTPPPTPVAPIAPPEPALPAHDPLSELPMSYQKTPDEPVSDPLQSKNSDPIPPPASIPDWLKPPVPTSTAPTPSERAEEAEKNDDRHISTSVDPLATPIPKIEENPQPENTTPIDPLTPTATDTLSHEELPDWLKPPMTPESPSLPESETSTTTEAIEGSGEQVGTVANAEVTPSPLSPSSELPDWLKESATSSPESTTKEKRPTIPKDTTKASPEIPSQSPTAQKITPDDIPDWLK